MKLGNDEGITKISKQLLPIYLINNGLYLHHLWSVNTNTQNTLEYFFKVNV